MRVSVIDIENQVEPSLLQEGLALVRTTNEFSIQQAEHGHYQVNASQPTYQVDIVMGAEGMAKVKCHCKPFIKSKKCKHAVAALLLLRDHLVQQRKSKTPSGQPSTVEEALRKMKITELRKFLIQYARSHASFKAELLAHTLHLTKKPDYITLLSELTPIDKYGQTKLNRNNIKTLRGIITTLLKQAQELFKEKALPETFQIIEPVITYLYRLIYKFPQYLTQLQVELRVALKIFETLCLQSMAPRLQQAAIKFATDLSSREGYFFVKNIPPVLRSVEPFVLEAKLRSSLLNLAENKLKTDQANRVSWAQLWFRWSRLWEYSIQKKDVLKLMQPLLPEVILALHQQKDYEDLLFLLPLIRDTKSADPNRKVSLQLGLRAAHLISGKEEIISISTTLIEDYLDVEAWDILSLEDQVLAKKIILELNARYTPGENEMADSLVLHGLKTMGLKNELSQRLVNLGDANLMMAYDHLLINEFNELVVKFYSDHIRTMKEMYGGTIARQKLNNIFSHLKSANLSTAVTENLKKMDSTKAESDPVPQIQGFVFDLDGVIVDTAVHHFQSWKKLMKELGKDIADEDDHHTRGASRMESLEYLLHKYHVRMSKEEKNELATRKNEYYLAAIEQITPDDLLPGSLQFLVESRNAGLRLALGSASKNARGVLKKLGIEDQFDAILDGYDAKESKPNPEIFIKACEALQLPPSSVVVFEDAQKGVKAALAAGCHCIGIGDPATLSDADIVIPNLAAMTPQEIIETLV